jgi:hypothetical protein
MSDDERNLFGPPPEEMLAELQRLALRLEVEIRTEGTGGKVGRCLLHGRWIVMMEKSLPLRDKVEGLARALADLDYENVYLSPACRDLLEGFRSRLP